MFSFIWFARLFTDARYAALFGFIELLRALLAAWLRDLLMTDSFFSSTTSVSAAPPPCAAVPGSLARRSALSYFLFRNSPRFQASYVAAWPRWFASFAYFGPFVG